MMNVNQEILLFILCDLNLPVLLVNKKRKIIFPYPPAEGSEEYNRCIALNKTDIMSGAHVSLWEERERERERNLRCSAVLS